MHIEFHLVQIDMKIVYSYLYQLELLVLNSSYVVIRTYIKKFHF